MHVETQSYNDPDVARLVVGQWRSWCVLVVIKGDGQTKLSRTKLTMKMSSTFKMSFDETNQDSIIELSTNSNLNPSKFNFTSYDDRSIVAKVEEIALDVAMPPCEPPMPSPNPLPKPLSKPSPQRKRKFISKIPRPIQRAPKETTVEKMNKLFAPFVADEPRTPRQMRRSNIGRLVGMTRTPEQAMKVIRSQIELHKSFF